MKETTQIQQKKPGAAKKPSEKKPCLIMVEGDYLGEVYLLDKSTAVIGRDEDCEIIITDTGVSRKHAMLEKKDDSFNIVDLKSTNGTEVNGTALSQPLLLKDGDKIHIGSTGLKFCFQDDIDAEYHKQLRNLAVKDGLTRIYNKRFFMDALAKEFSYAQRHNIALSVLIFDIDHFKKLNDTYGHPAGDYVLKRLANILEKGIRGYDVFARFGGEEFCFLLRGLSQTAALPFAERIRKLIDESHFAFEEKQLQVTISVGLATFDAKQTHKSSEALLAAADAALYEAKRAGRNQVAAAK